MAGPRNDPEASVPRATRWVVRIFLLAVLITVALRLEAWPLTGFRLFSNLRQEVRTTWVARTVAPDGKESTLWFDDLPRPYQDFYLLMPGFRRLPPSKQRSICAAWLAEARRVRPRTAALRIYRVERDLRPGTAGRPAREIWRRLQYACS